MEKYLSTAGGRITCLRCTAKSVRSGSQCLKPALKSSRTAKCGHHGGRNKGPISEAGKARSAAAHIKTGEFTKQAIRERSQKLAEMMNLEDCLMILKMTSASRTRGRKPAGYTPLVTIKDVVMFALDKEINRVGASDEEQ
ncbi:MAG: hypothetical protein EBQ84_00740 [Betaproteobacteria bacterium]|nr:hypothetical protein [Betaproteobacteria bacterium]